MPYAFRLPRMCKNHQRSPPQLRPRLTRRVNSEIGSVATSDSHAGNGGSLRGSRGELAANATSAFHFVRREIECTGEASTSLPGTITALLSRFHAFRMSYRERETDGGRGERESRTFKKKGGQPIVSWYYATNYTRKQEQPERDIYGTKDELDFLFSLCEKHERSSVRLQFCCSPVYRRRTSGILEFSRSPKYVAGERVGASALATGPVNAGHRSCGDWSIPTS